MNFSEHRPPHFHATYGGDEVLVSINDIEVLEGAISSKQQKMLLGWAALHQEELLENWVLAEKKKELFEIEPLR
jgi:DNA polymerase/3'-5' exonuclease PolX